MIFFTDNFWIGEVTKKPINLFAQPYRFIDKQKKIKSKFFSIPLTFEDQVYSRLDWIKVIDVSDEIKPNGRDIIVKIRPDFNTENTQD